MTPRAPATSAAAEPPARRAGRLLGRIPACGAGLAQRLAWLVSTARAATVVALWLAGDAFAGDGAPEPDAPPPPYSAEQIAAAYTPAVRLTWELTDASGQIERREMTIGPGDDPSRARLTDHTAAPDDPSAVTTPTWASLRDHAAFPVGATRRRARCRAPVLPGGGGRGWRYVVPAPSSDSTRVFCFASRLPGPPVTIVHTDAQGVVLQRMTQVAREAAPAMR